jgi:hypothetical protein
MNIKAISNVVTSNLGRQVLQAQKHSPTLMFAGGVVGVVATVVLASKATLKVDAVVEEAAVNISKAKGLRSADHPDYSELDYNRDRTLIYVKSATKLVKLYGPAIVVGTCSIGLLTGAHVTLSKRNAGLVAAYAAVDKAFKEYRGRVVDELGEDKDREFRFGSAEKEIYSEKKNGEPKVTRVKTAAGHSQYARFFDNMNLNFQTTREYNLLFLQGHQNYLNDKLKARGHVFLNEAYDALGMERTVEGAVVGWLSNGEGDGYIDFGIWDDKDMLRMHDFMVGNEDSILIDFNVDGVVYDKI